MFDDNYDNLNNIVFHCPQCFINNNHSVGYVCGSAYISNYMILILSIAF
jgi:hypothetical protein